MTSGLKLEMARFSAEHLAKLTKKNVAASTRNLMLTKIIAEYGGALSSIAANIIDENRNCRFVFHRSFSSSIT